jgi:hypothetical protein
MKPKFLPIFSIVIVSILAIFFLIDFNSLNRDLLSQTFVVDAVYFEEDGHIQILFEDKSQKTSKVILEVLGMPESYQKIYYSSKFIETIEFGSPPQFGWKTHPVTFIIEHEEFGNLGLKTEIHLLGEPPKPIIYSQL